MLLQVVCFGISTLTNSGILINVLDILSKFDDDMIPTGVTITYQLHFDYCVPLRCFIFYDEYGSLIRVE